MRKISLKRGEKNRKGLSPIITTVLLIALVIVIISIVFLWFRGMVQEGVTKFGKNIQLVCDEVQFDASYDSSSGMLNLVNTGNIPLFRINLRLADGGNYQTKDITDIVSDWPEGGLGQGATFTGNIGTDFEEITLLPVLIGTSAKGKKTFVCGGQYGKKLDV